MKKILFLFLSFLSFSGLFSQVTIQQQNFDGATPLWGYSINPATYNISSDYWAIRTTNNAPTGTSGNFWALRDLENGNGGGAFDHTMTFNSVNVSAYTGVTISFRYYTIGYDGPDYLQYKVAYNGGAFGSAVNLNKNTNAWTTVTINVPASTTSVQLQMIGRQNGGSDYAGWDDFKVEGTASSSCTPPTNQASGSSITGLGNNGATINWTGGNGGNSLVVVKEGSVVGGSPSNSTTYTASASFGGADEIATDEEVVYASNGASVAVTNLTQGTTYYYAIYEYDGATGSECYNTTSPETGSFTTTLPACTAPSSQVSSFTFSNVSASNIDVSWTAITADNYLVVRHTAAALGGNPSNTTTYSVGNTIGSGTVVYNGSGTSFSDGSLSQSTTYYYFIYAYNDQACSGGPIYLSPSYSDNETTLVGPCLSDDFNSGYGNWTGGSGTYQNSTVGVTGNGTGFNDTNDDIITSATVANPSSITFTARASGSTSNFSIRIQYSSSSSGPWTDASVISANGSNSGDITNVSSPFNLALGLTGSYYLRIVQSPRSGGSFYLDDVDVFCGAGCTPPATQASAASISNPTSSSLDVSWTAGSGTNTIVVVKEASAVTNTPSAGTTYTANSTFGSGDDLGSSEFVVYNSTGNSLTITGLNQGTTYHIAVFAFNSVDNCYNQVGAATANGTTSCNATPDNVTAFATAGCENGGVDLSWTNPSICWDNVLVFASETNCTSNTPSGNGAAYSPSSSVYGLGDDDLETGVAYLVYKGTGNSVSLTGLTNGQEYCFKIFTRNGTTWSSGVEVSCTPTVPIPDNACGSNEVSNTINYVGVSNVSDVNVFVSIEHDYRADLNIELESPTGTIVQLFDGSNSGSENNLEVIFDDAGSAITSNAHTINGTEDETIVSDVDLLSTFNGEVANGNWILRVCDDASGDLGNFIEWSIDITESCTPTHTVSSISPNTGPIGTTVEITGTGFTTGTTVDFGAQSAIVTYNSATSLSVEVPAGATTGSLTLTESGCPIQSGTFTVLGGASGSCISSAGSFTDLIISEVYDADAGSYHYVELFNPTSATIDLSNYEVEITAGGAAQNPKLQPTGMLASGGVYLIAIGSGSSPCSGVTADLTNTINSNLGFDESGSAITLIKNSVDLDYIDVDAEIASSSPGFSIYRDASATGPTTTYNGSDWTNILVEDCSDLGTAPFTTYPNPTLTALADLEACELDFSVTVTEGDASTMGDVTYKWYYNDGSNSWTEVTSADPANLTILGETGDNLLIGSGVASISTISGFEFYCEVTEDGSCVNTSNVAKFEFKPEPYFRTKGSGLSQGSWDDISLWEMSTDLVTWNSACVYPTASNSDSIIIQAADSIAIVEGIGTPDVTADQLYVASTGILLIDESAEFNLENGNASGEDILIDGVLIDKSSNGAGNGLSFLNGSTWLLGANGTVIKTYSSSVNVYRDNYETGIANIPATAHWAYVNMGQGLVAVSSIDMYYPNLYFESVNGNYDALAFNEIFKGQTGYTTIKGDLSIGLGTISAGTGTYKVYNNNFNPQALLILGDVYIGPGSSLTNASYNGGNSTSHDNGTGIEVKGGFAIDGSLDISSGQGKTILSGTSKQDILSASGTGTYNTYDFILDNALNTELTDIDVTISNSLTFTNGKIITDVTSSDMVYITNSATNAIVGGATSGSSRFVEGKLQWTTDGASSYTFPIGHSAQNAQGFTIDVTGASSDILGFLDANNSAPIQAYAYCDLETHPGGGTVNAGNGNAGYDGVLDQIEFNLASPLQWNVTNPGGGITSYDLTVLANGGQEIAPVTSANGLEVRYLLKNGEPGNAGVATTTGAPSFSATGFDLCPNGYALSGMTSFSKFTLNGANQSNTTLPVELLYFDAEIINSEQVLCSWATVTEISNDFFTVERSLNGVDFSPIGMIEGAGTYIGEKQYEFIDSDSHSGTVYYRLKQTDFDGAFELSQIESVQFSTNTSSGFSVFPIPFENSISVSNNSDELVMVGLYDVNGKLIKTEQFTVSTELDLSQLAAGPYFIKMISLTSSESLRILKK